MNCNHPNLRPEEESVCPWCQWENLISERDELQRKYEAAKLGWDGAIQCSNNWRVEAQNLQVKLAIARKALEPMVNCNQPDISILLADAGKSLMDENERLKIDLENSRETGKLMVQAIVSGNTELEELKRNQDLAKEALRNWIQAFDFGMHEHDCYENAAKVLAKLDE